MAGARKSRPVLVNGRFLGGAQTGLQRVSRSLLSALRSRGVALEVVAPSRAPGVDRVVAGPAGRLGGLLWEQAVLPYIARGRPLVSLTNTGPVLAARALVMVHDLAPLVEPRWFRRDMQLYGHVVVLAARRARVVVTVSDQVRDELVARGVARDNVVVVRNALDASWRPATAQQISAVRAKFGIDGPFVVHVGWPDPRKDAAMLVQAHRRAVGVAPHTLVLVGTPRPNFAPVTLPDLSSVRRLTGINDDELRALLTGASALAFPSRYEGFGIPPLEAIACGTPAVVADTPALREATDGNAVTLPVGDVDAWTSAIVDAIEGRLPIPGPPPNWTWDDASEVFEAALRRLDE